MEHKHTDNDFAAIETLATRMDELITVFGPAATPVIERVRQRLIGAMAARDRGDGDTAMSQIGSAMAELTQLAGTLDPAEAGLMRSVADGFQRALQRRSEGEARERAAFMMQRSGAVARKKDPTR